MNHADFSELKGKTITSIENLEIGRGYDESITFDCNDGTSYAMRYNSDCCASCDIEDICGDVNTLLNTPILLAEEVSQDASNAPGRNSESSTWTFYKLSTIKGSVTIRWYGSSNGYYSESASFYKL